MYNADRVRETTTTTGTGTVTLAGAAAQHQTFTSRVITGDQCDYCILDANGTAWEVGTGTMATSSTLSRDTILQSSNSDAAINLSAGTHTVFLTFSADMANKRFVAADTFIDHVASGFVFPASSGTLALTIPTGVAYVVGKRVVKGAQAHTYTASKDTYVDLNHVGTLTYAEVANGAGAPALTANSIRLGKVVSGGSTISSTVQTGKDSLGNWLFNTVNKPVCKLDDSSNATSLPQNTNTAIPFNSAGHETLDNDGMHSISVNNTRITIQRDGLYEITGSYQINNVSTAPAFFYALLKINGTATDSFGGTYAVTSTYPATGMSYIGKFAAGDYIEFCGNQSGATTQVTGNAHFAVVKIS